MNAATNSQNTAPLQEKSEVEEVLIGGTATGY